MTDSRPDETPWNEEFAQSLTGSVVLVGLTFLEESGEIKKQGQFYGRVLRAHSREGILLGLEGMREGEQFNLPPDTSAIHVATPGEYHLRTTGEVLVDPDFVAIYTIAPAR